MTATERKPVTALTFQALRAANATRTLRWHKSGLDEWSLADWVVAVGGEVGEALNVVKKLNRDRDGQPGNKKSRPELLSDLGDELADGVIYLDTVLSSENEEPLGALWDWTDFASVRWGIETEFAGALYPVQSSDFGTALLAAGGKLATTAAEDPADIGSAADEVLKAIDAVAWHFEIDLAAAVIRKFNATSQAYNFPERLAASEDDGAEIPDTGHPYGMELPAGKP